MEVMKKYIFFTIVFLSLIHPAFAGDVEIKSLRTVMSESGNWVDLTFLIKNNTSKHIKYVMVELAGWDKKKDGVLMISSDYMSDPTLSVSGALAFGNVINGCVIQN